MLKSTQKTFISQVNILSTEKMRALDTQAKVRGAQDDSIESIASAGYEIMKEAGKALFDLIVKRINIYSKDWNPNLGIAIFVGSGNNGGDGLVLAKLLIEAGIQETVIILAPEANFKNEAKLALEDFKKAGGSLIDFSMALEQASQESDSEENVLCDFNLIVDCMLGNGATGELREPYATAVRYINKSGIPVVAADSPTGYDCTEHVRREPCIKASETMLFGFPRLDAYIQDGGRVFGDVSVAPLPYPETLVEQFSEKTFLVNDEFIRELLPKRNEWGDKRSQGCAMILAGSKDMPGAAALCTKAALRSGAGLITLASPEACMSTLQTKLTEPVFCSLRSSNAIQKTVSENANSSDVPYENAPKAEVREEFFTSAHIPQILKSLEHNQAFAIGPGLGTSESTQAAVLELLGEVECQTVIDADALNAIASTGKSGEPRECSISFLQNIPAPAILTPHRREFERLFGKLPEKDIDIPNTIRTLATSANKVILLKGAPTFIATPDGNVYVIPASNSGMAKGGSGDVLTGIIVALLAQGMEASDAALLGALLHQKAGAIARKELGAYSMLPSDIIRRLPKAFEF